MPAELRGRCWAELGHPTPQGSQDLKGSAHSRSLLMCKKMSPRNGKSPLPGFRKVSHLFIWRELTVVLLLQI